MGTDNDYWMDEDCGEGVGYREWWETNYGEDAVSAKGPQTNAGPGGSGPPPKPPVQN